MKKTLKRWFQDKIGIGENRDKLALLEKRLAALATLEQWALPEVLPIPSEAMNEAWSAAMDTLGLSEPWNACSRAIHRSDPCSAIPFKFMEGTP